VHARTRRLLGLLALRAASGTSLAELADMGLRRMWRGSRARGRPHNLLAISDLHLGCDLKAGSRPARKNFDAQLAEFLDYHADHKKDDKPWRLILNGDIVDFVAITVMPEKGEGFEISDEEREFGLASAEAKCVWKLRKTFERHRQVFDALARFLHKGNFVHIVRGNHDSEFHWPGVQAEFRNQLADRLGLTGWARRRLEHQIQFHPWFYLEPGFFYAEHGNAHDRYSVQTGFFDFTGVPREGEMDLPLSSLVLRYFANRYAEQTDLDEVDTWGVPEYIDWVLKAGNPLRIAADYFVMVFRVTYPIFVQSLNAWRRFARAANRAISRVDDGQVAHVRKLLGRFSGDEAQLRQLLGIASRPAEQSLFDSMQLFYLDRMLLALLCLFGSWAALGSANGLVAKIGSVVGIGIVFAAFNALLGRMRTTDSHPMLQQAARRIAQIFDVKVIVMGHSHRVVDEPIGGSARYLNLGSWTNAREGFPHVVVEDGIAELRYWRGPSAQPAAVTENRGTLPVGVPATA
jgi:UDP-2,3-diacylglucosamine pyrophosphatase LpxH